MADSIKIGSLDISAFKVGSADCKVYLGDVLLYPQSQPQVKDYFRFIAREDGTFKLSGNSLSYSLDSGTTWTSLASDTYSPTVSSGSSIMFKATNPTVNNGIGRFVSTGTFDVEGNIMSLIYGDDFETATTITNVGQFRSLFDNTSTYCGVVNASGLTLPATTVSQDAYRSMFWNCSGLTTAPALPATTLGDSCYKYMFNQCSSLTSVPALPATNLAQSCYSQMFNGCTSLTTVPSNLLSATTIQSQCYEYMFRDCTSLTTAPELLATVLAERCYQYMFYNCTSLTTAPSSIGNSSTTMATSACTSMFQHCTSLTTAPELPATVLAERCYQYMFLGCTSLTTAPELPATVLTERCYQYMFQNCTSLNYIKCLATDISAINCIIGWVTNVAASGTFVKAEGMRSWRRGAAGIPSGWLVLPSDSFAITSLAANNTITLTNNRQSSTNSSFSYSLDKGATWTDFTLSSGQTKTIATINSGDTIHLKGSNNTLASNYNYGHYFRGSGDYEISGEISSLINGNDSDTEISGASRYTFAMLFSGDTHLVNAENLKVSSTQLPESCFNSTFRSCTNLVKAPELPSTILGSEAYSSMFESCTGLAYPPTELNFTSVQSKTYNRMFCMSRSSKITTPAMTYTPKMFGDWGSVAPATSNMQMFCGNGNLTDIYCYWTNTSGSFGNIANWVNYTDDTNVTFHKRSTQSFVSGVNGIKTGWTVVNDDSTQPT